jgi:uncharacterized protein (DUF433 family)
MEDQPASVQRSFRLSPRTLEMLEHAAEASGLSRNALADRLLSEALRIDAHPQVRFHEGVGHRRRARLAGTRLYVYQVISTLRDGGGNVTEAAESLDLRNGQVAAALAYYADYQDEIDDDLADALRFEAEERARWERQQRAVA